MSTLFRNKTQEELDDLVARVEELSQRVAELWGHVAGESCVTPRSYGLRRFSANALFGISLETLARKTGYRLVGGDNLEVVVRTAVRQVERAASRRLEKLIAPRLGGGLLASLVGGGVAALVDAGIASITRLFKKRRLDLPQVEERAYGGFPRYARKAGLMPPGTERDDRLEHKLADVLERSIAEGK